jgi:hypothetical protein
MDASVSASLASPQAFFLRVFLFRLLLLRLLLFRLGRGGEKLIDLGLECRIRLRAD